MIGESGIIGLAAAVAGHRPGGCQHHRQGAGSGGSQPGDGPPEAQLKSGNGSLIAHGDQQEANELESHVGRAH